jgi:hypothetical protein
MKPYICTNGTDPHIDLQQRKDLNTAYAVCVILFIGENIMFIAQNAAQETIKKMHSCWHAVCDRTLDGRYAHQRSTSISESWSWKAREMRDSVKSTN